MPGRRLFRRVHLWAALPLLVPAGCLLLVDPPRPAANVPVDVPSDLADHPSCPVGRSWCAGRCVDPQTDPGHCGACDQACPAVANATPACRAGRCAAACHPGFADCDGTPGCEAALAGPEHCGRCDRACPADRPTCTPVAAGYECTPGCESPTPDRCGDRCVDTTRDPSACGYCGAACPVRLNAERTCIDGRCGFGCRAGFADCDRDASNGCEVNLLHDPAHCGACLMACPAPLRARATCGDGSCGAACLDGFGDCNGSASDGCEVSLALAPAHCGACGHACMSGERCVAGTCLCVAPEETRCGGRCTDIHNDPGNCGACGHGCAPTEMYCVGGACTPCMPGRTLCAGSCVDTSTSIVHCGTCGHSCPYGCWSGVCYGCRLDTDCEPGRTCRYSSCVEGSSDGGLD